MKILYTDSAYIQKSDGGVTISFAVGGQGDEEIVAMVGMSLEAFKALTEVMKRKSKEQPMNKLNTIQLFRKQFALHPFIWIGAKDPKFGTAQEKVEQFILQEQNRLLDVVLKLVGEDEKEIIKDSYKGRGRPSKTSRTVISMNARARNQFRKDLVSSIEELKEGVNEL